MKDDEKVKYIEKIEYEYGIDLTGIEDLNKLTAEELNEVFEKCKGIERKGIKLFDYS